MASTPKPHQATKTKVENTCPECFNFLKTLDLLDEHGVYRIKKEIIRQLISNCDCHEDYTIQKTAYTRENTTEFTDVSGIIEFKIVSSKHKYLIRLGKESSIEEL